MVKTNQNITGRNILALLSNSIFRSLAGYISAIKSEWYIYWEVKKNISFWFEFWLDDLWSALTNNKNLQPVSNKRRLIPLSLSPRHTTCEIDTNMIRNHQSVLSIRFSRTSILIFINSAMFQRNIWCLLAIPNTRYDSSYRFFYTFIK